MSKSFWLHRISYHAEVAYPLLKKNLLSIGFSDFSENNFLNECTNNWENFEKYFDKKWNSRPRSRYSLWRFFNEMKKGDFVIVPSWGTFSIFEITDSQCLIMADVDTSNLQDWNGNSIIHDTDKNLCIKKEKLYQIDLGFFKKVKPIILDASRNDFADSALTARMKSRPTNADISDIKESIEKAIDAYNKQKPINLQSLILENNLQTTLDIIKKELNPDKLEKLVQWYLKKVGASDVFIPAKNESNKEGDADVIATFENIKTIIYAQVKFHDGETDKWALDQIEAYKDHKEKSDDGYSKIAWVISTADTFSKDCYEKAKKNKVQLIEGKQFTKMLLEIGTSELNQFV